MSRKEIKSIQIVKEEVKQHLFIDGVILHRENPKESTKKFNKISSANIQDKHQYAKINFISIYLQ